MRFPGATPDALLFLTQCGIRIVRMAGRPQVARQKAPHRQVCWMWFIRPSANILTAADHEPEWTSHSAAEWPSPYQLISANILSTIGNRNAPGHVADLSSIFDLTLEERSSTSKFAKMHNPLYAG